MGLDLRLSYRKEESIYEGNGKTAFAFVRNWVLDKGEVGKLLAIKGSEDYSNYYLECDW